MDRTHNRGANRVAALVAACRAGYSLPREFYFDPGIFELDLDLLLERWTFAGHESEVGAPGDFLVVELGAESAIVVRGEDGRLRAMANVCRHRGSRVCLESHGSAVSFTCPYHAWSYRLDGSLRAAREMPDGFEPSSFALQPLPLRVVGGLVFISFADHPPDIGDVAKALETMTARYRWPEAKVAARRRYAVAANWKLVMENYHECYHCQPAHPEFSILHDLARPGMRGLEAPDDFEAWSAEPDGAEVGRVMRSALSSGRFSGTKTGAPAAPAMTVDPDAAGVCVFAELGFLSAFLAYRDHGVVYRFAPRGVRETEMEVLWLVDREAREGVDYDLDRLTWLWDVTSVADKKIIENNQAGVGSRAYRPGPYSLMEPGTRAYVERYLGEMKHRLEAPSDVP